MPEPLDFNPITGAGRPWRERFGSGHVAPMEAVTSIVRVQQIVLARCTPPWCRSV